MREQRRQVRFLTWRRIRSDRERRGEVVPMGSARRKTSLSDDGSDYL
jgi:hypothetical protein